MYEITEAIYGLEEAIGVIEQARRTLDIFDADEFVIEHLSEITNERFTDIMETFEDEIKASLGWDSALKAELAEEKDEITRKAFESGIREGLLIAEAAIKDLATGDNIVDIVSERMSDVS